MYTYANLKKNPMGILKYVLNMNHALHRHRERNDNRWKHGPLFYNPSLYREVWKGKASKKPTHIIKETVSLSDFGLPDTICSKVKLYQLFEDNKIITQDIFELKFNCPINFLNYASLTKAIKTIIKTDEGKIDMNDGENPPHFKSHFHELFGKNTKGSQTFRKILKYDAPNNPIYDTNIWCKKAQY